MFDIGNVKPWVAQLDVTRKSITNAWVYNNLNFDHLETDIFEFIQEHISWFVLCVFINVPSFILNEHVTSICLQLWQSVLIVTWYLGGPAGGAVERESLNGATGQCHIDHMDGFMQK